MMDDDSPEFYRHDEAIAERNRREQETRYTHEVVPTGDGRYRVQIVRPERGGE